MPFYIYTFLPLQLVENWLVVTVILCIGGSCSWQWQDENGCWQTYDHSVCVQLEKALTSGDTHVEVTAACQKYRIDVKRLEQINVKTKVGRNVQRISNGNWLCSVLPNAVNFSTAE